MDKITEKDANTNLYFVTKADMKSKTTLEPRIPQNFLTDNGFEDNKIKRVCFSTSINGAVTALSQNLKNTDLFVYSPIGIEKRDIYTPSISQVPDRSITGEVWIRKPVQIECIGKIHVIDAKKNPQRYKYGNKIAELYEWNWKWIDKNINESVSSVYGAYDAHGKWNAAVDVDGRTYRYRVECLVINGDKVFVSLDKHGNLIIPGGSAEKDIDDITQVANECREEARINIKNPIYTGINRIQGCPPHISKHKSVLPFEYDGSLSKVYVAEYDSDYNGYIDEYDKDEKMIRGKFVPLKDVINRLKPEWREALNKYTNVYYRVTYNGEGIYNALKNNIPLNVWMDLLKSDAMRWLPKPPKYNESSRSYFTKEGFKMFMRKTYPVMRKYLNPEFVNIEEVRLPDKMMYSDKYQVVTESSETKYDPPYTYDEIVKNYGKDMADKLVADPAHKFRCHTGIELIHKEPSLRELNRIHSNWQLMTDEQKRKSDMKSRELFGCDNETNYTRLVKTYNEACKDVKTARKFVSEVGKLAKKYDANYFIVTDGASGIHNNGNPAVKNARDSQVEWEKKHGFDPDEDWSDTLATESAKNNKGKVVPKKCPKCGSPVRIFLRGEPVFLCSNKKCGKFFGVVPFKESVELNDTIPPTSFISKCKMTKSFRKFSPDFYGARHDWYYNGDWVGGCIIVYNNTHEKKRIHDKLYNTDSIYFYPGIWIDDLYVDEKYRGRGLARDICKLCISEYGVDHIACVRGNSVISLYKSLGFEVYKREQDDLNYIYYMKMNGNVNESVKHSKLPDDVFGIPQERKYPMQDKQHVKAAIKFFNYVEPKYEEQLANRIIENMKIYNIDASSIGDKNRLKKYIKESTMEGSYSNMRESLADDLAFMYFESENDSSIPDLIEPVIKQLESKGYQVKYASPGHVNTRFDNDRNKDGVINAKMTSTARIIFSRDYHFNTTPQGWEWKVLHNDAKALYVKPYTYNEKMGSKEDAFKKWQTFYISNIKTWAAELPKVGSDKKTAPDTNF